MKLKIGISPCPNDTYIFEAIYNKKLQLKDIEFNFVFEDVQTLNEMAARNELDIVKISYAHYFSVLQHYIMLKSGGAMGDGVGPLLVSKRTITPDEIKNGRIAIPGIHTTAHFLFSFAFPEATQKIPYSFELIEDAVLRNEADAGVIIHENRFTYADKGLQKIRDLGHYWQQQTLLPIPLGGIAIRRALPYNIQQDVNNLIKRSIVTANQNPDKLNEFIRSHAQEMNDEVMKKHIDLYVNSFSLDVGVTGELAVEKMREFLNNDSSLKLFI